MSHNIRMHLIEQRDLYRLLDASDGEYEPLCLASRCSRRGQRRFSDNGKGHVAARAAERPR